MQLISHLLRVSRQFATRALSTTVAPKVEKLTSRSLLRLSGTEVSTFLQGLVTNDMRHLEDGAQAMYCVFLNNKGRVMYDSIVYRPPEEEGTYLVECATDSLSALQKHLKLYRVRKKINIDDINNEFNIWAAYGEDNLELKSDNNDIIIIRDPRLKELGYRIIANKSIDITQELGGISANNYTDLRYSLGVGEGVEELPPGNCFPLEANCDYLHGVSFFKGCYIGQELTARTHHTGVVRKRLMPVNFKPGDVSELPSLDTPVLAPQERAAGKLRALSPSGEGLGLLRVAEALKYPDQLTAGSLKISTHRPSWWPAEASKERPSS